MNQRDRRRLGSGTLLGLFAALLAFAGIALAAVGLQNPSFENGLDNWEVRTERGQNRTVVYGPGGQNGESVPCDDSPYGICVVGVDTFDYVDNGNYNEIKSAEIEPIDGAKMLRLGGPFEHNSVRQNNDRFIAAQTFMVDPDHPVLELSYNILTYDYVGYDEFEFRVTLTDEDGDVIARQVQGAFGTGVELKESGWQPNQIDLSGYAGQQVHLRLSSAQTIDNLYPFWAYVDAGLVDVGGSPGANSSASAPPLPGGGQVNLNKYVDPSSGKAYYTAPSSQVSQFPGGCMPITIKVPIEPGAGTVSNVSLLLNGNPTAMSEIGGSTWEATIPCAEEGDLVLEYDLTEDGTTQRFAVPIGGIVLIDPQGVVYDKAEFDQAKAGGASDEAARAAAAIQGATVRLQRESGGTFQNVLSGDPGISPNVNPEITGSDGLYQWDVSAGTYRVRVTKPAYVAVTSASVDIPPPVLDLHIPMVRYDTKIDSGPGASTEDTTPTFGFSANDPAGSTFECRVDAGGFGPCGDAGAHTTGELAPGEHTFAVRGTDSTGFTDPTPASRTFTVTTPAPNSKPEPEPDPSPSGPGGGKPGGGGPGGGGPGPDDGPTACDAAGDSVAAAQAKADRAKKVAKKAKKKAKKAKKKAKKAKQKGGKKAKKAKKAAKKAKKAAKKAGKKQKKANKALEQAKSEQEEVCG